MADYTKSAIYKVRKWMINELYSNGIINQSNYTSSSPIIPVQQVPEADSNTSGAGFGIPDDAPFIVYDFLTPGGYDTDYWNRRDEVMLWIYDYDLDKVLEIREFLYDLFGRFDLTAADINNFSDGSPYIFHFFDVMMGLPTDEADQVLGRVGANMVITYEYTRPLSSNGRFA